MNFFSMREWIQNWGPSIQWSTTSQEKGVQFISKSLSERHYFQEATITHFQFHGIIFFIKRCKYNKRNESAVARTRVYNYSSTRCSVRPCRDYGSGFSNLHLWHSSDPHTQYRGQGVWKTGMLAVRFLAHILSYNLLQQGWSLAKKLLRNLLHCHRKCFSFLIIRSPHLVPSTNTLNCTAFKNKTSQHIAAPAPETVPGHLSMVSKPTSLRSLPKFPSSLLADGKPSMCSKVEGRADPLTL